VAVFFHRKHTFCPQLSSLYLSQIKIQKSPGIIEKTGNFGVNFGGDVGF
jgi:hypothetical protein